MIYAPKEDSHLLEKQVRRFAKNKIFLDMGAGSGIQSEVALEQGAKKVFAVELDSTSLKFLKNKFAKTSVKIIKSNLFEKFKEEKYEGEKFDLIAFNAPYLPEDEREPQDSRNATTGGKVGDEITIRFLEQSKKYLSKNGIILLVVSSLTSHKRIKELIKKLGYKKIRLSEQKMFMEKLEVWKIYFSK